MYNYYNNNNYGNYNDHNNIPNTNYYKFNDNYNNYTFTNNYNNNSNYNGYIKSYNNSNNPYYNYYNNNINHNSNNNYNYNSNYTNNYNNKINKYESYHNIKYNNYLDDNSLNLSTDDYTNSLMDKKIRKFYIGFERLGWDLIHNINDLRSGFPFGQERELFHSTAFFLVEDNLGVIADYGGKKKNGFLPISSSNMDKDGYNYIYGQKGGARYKEMTINELKKKSFEIIDLKMRRYNPPTVKELLKEICDEWDWTKEKYNLFEHNCQNFVCKCIKKLDAVREKFSFFRGFHNKSVAKYPVRIIRALEENEEDLSSLIDRVPIIGPIEEMIRVPFAAGYLILKDLFS